MKIVRVTYTTKAEYAAQNQANIQHVMSELEQLNHPGISYNVCLSDDGRTFVHSAFFKADEDQAVLQGLPAFKAFGEQLRANGLDSPVKQESPSLVGWTNNFFNDK